uniref:Peptidase aspartic putative domain-containing protein n=1 Tax=Anopheles stephensi TaxID=30069 RepID=A0A182YRD5_ANOST
MNQPASTKASASRLRSLHDVSDEVIRALDAMKQEGRDIWLIHILTEKLDLDTKQLWCLKQAAEGEVSRVDNISNWNVPNDVVLADPTFNVKGRIDLFIGSEWFWQLIKPYQLNMGDNLPILTKTALGWTIGGVIYTDVQVIAKTFCITNTDTQFDILTKFYKIETCDEYVQKLDDEETVKHFQDTHRRDTDGRLWVRLPFKPNCE